MASIDINDIIFASVSFHGTTLANIRLSGVTTFRDILAVIRREIGTLTGLLTISLRNMTQGWTGRHSVLMSRPHAGIQLSLF